MAELAPHRQRHHQYYICTGKPTTTTTLTPALRTNTTDRPMVTTRAPFINMGRSKNKYVATDTALLTFPGQILKNTQGEYQTGQKPCRR